MHRRDFNSSVLAGLTAINLDTIGIGGGPGPQQPGSVSTPFLERSQSG